MDAVGQMGWETPTAIQEKAIPVILSGRDVLGQSETGSGKTGAFGIPIAEMLEKGQGLQALIISPTRELVEQIWTVMRQLTKEKRLYCESVYGGVGINPQIMGLRKAEICVGTPGRLLDHMERKTIDLSKIRIMVVDEADKLFEMGFIDDVRRILGGLPKERQTLMFSATLRSDIRKFIERHTHNPIHIETKFQVDTTKLKQVYYPVKRNKKISLLVHLIHTEKPGLAIVFCGTRRETDLVERNLKLNNINAAALHGGLSQARRNKVMDSFRRENTHVLVATDVAARGIDIRNITHVINYAIPSSPKEYVHRIGRTARMGDKGKAISLLDERDHDNFRAVQSDHSLNIQEMPIPTIPYVKVTGGSLRGHTERGNRRSYGGGRPSSGRRNEYRRDGPPRGRGGSGFRGSGRDDQHKNNYLGFSAGM
ncbi:MAG: DEAD/DEAH box helicase [DPANN group archaeon]|nr:DEAD/DEAH box helicase [DPANN group archaeon]